MPEFKTFVNWKTFHSLFRTRNACMESIHFSSGTPPSLVYLVRCWHHSDDDKSSWAFPPLLQATSVQKLDGEEGPGTTLQHEHCTLPLYTVDPHLSGYNGTRPQSDMWKRWICESSGSIISTAISFPAMLSIVSAAIVIFLPLQALDSRNSGILMWILHLLNDLV